MDSNQAYQIFETLISGTAPQSVALPILWRFLQGFDLELDRDGEPFMLLAEAAVQYRAIDLMAELVAEGITDLCEQRINLQQHERALYNLLHLCIELRRDQILGSRVWLLYDQRVPQGTYRAAKLPEVLRGAMVYNQPRRSERDTLEVWGPMIQGHVDPFIGGRQLVGFKGAIRSRTIRDQEGPERLYGLGACFRLFFQHTMKLDPKTRELDRRAALEQILLSYPGLRRDDLLDAANLLQEFAPIDVLRKRFRDQWPAESEQVPYLKEFVMSGTADDAHTERLNRAFACGMRDYRDGSDSDRLRGILFTIKKLLPHAGGPLRKDEFEQQLKKAASV